MTEPIYTGDLGPEVGSAFLETLSALESKFALTIEDSFDPGLKDYSLFDHYQNIRIREAFRIASLNAHILYVLVEYSYYGSKGGIHHAQEYQAWGAAKLDIDPGHVLIKRETLTEKIQELINKQEIDFPEDPQFSRRFYVLSKDPVKTRMALTEKFRTKLKELATGDALIEIKDRQLVIGFRTPVNSKDALLIAGLVSRLAK